MLPSPANFRVWSVRQGRAAFGVEIRRILQHAMSVCLVAESYRWWHEQVLVVIEGRRRRRMLVVVERYCL